MVLNMDVHEFRNLMGSNDFSYEGLEVLFDYYEVCYGGDFQFDYESIRGSWTEYTLNEIDQLREDYCDSFTHMDEMEQSSLTDDDVIEIISEDYCVLHTETSVIVSH